MTFASLLTGWECGYSVTLIGMNVLVFFAEYFGRSIKGNYVKALPLSILSTCVYTATYFFDKKNGAYYELPDQVVYRMQIMGDSSFCDYNFYSTIVYATILPIRTTTF